jgi:hypothetical protein
MDSFFFCGPHFSKKKKKRCCHFRPASFVRFFNFSNPLRVCLQKKKLKKKEKIPLPKILRSPEEDPSLFG